MSEAIPDTGEVSVLRLADGPVLVYDEAPDKRRPVALRAVVLPDGDVLEVEHKRFGRAG